MSTNTFEEDSFEKGSAAFRAWQKAKAASRMPNLEMFDFQDGNGPAPAYQHTNNTGSIGGWVAWGSAHVDKDAHIEDGALVYGNAHVGKNVRVMSGAQIRGNSVLKGNMMVGNRVVFDGHANCTLNHQLRHPVYIGYHPFSFPVFTMDDNGFNVPDHQDIPELRITSHPVIKRTQRGSNIWSATFTDDHLIVTQTPRGRSLISEFRDDMAHYASPTGKEMLSWNPSRNQVLVLNHEQLNLLREISQKQRQSLYPNERAETITEMALQSHTWKRVVKPCPQWAAEGSTYRWH